MSAYEFVDYSVEDPVAVIRLNRPEKLNAFTYPMLAEIRSAVNAATADPAVVGIVITGTGRGFSAGLDSGALAEVTSTGGANRDKSPGTELPGLFSYLIEVPKPVIAAVNGVTAGGGFVLASLCDVRIASTAASFTTVFLKRGLIAEHGMTWILPRMLGPGRALDLLWTSERFDARRAHELGYVEYVCEPDELLDRAKDYVRTIAANAGPTGSMETKRLVYRHMGAMYPEALREADEAQWRVVAHPDAAEGARALIEKREPRWTRLGAKE
ncbi:MAG: enoyl-CoA hydratase/isomerase family protein [Dehalococcoidia bacterium]|nr:enoyl-CoA hydratase/isomerase family protein [Dehalococcoidia bacterium]